MMTYPISSNLCTKISLHCYWLHNFPSFSSNHGRCSVRKGALRNFAKFTGKHLWQSLFFNKVAVQAEGTASDLSRAFSWRFLVYSISTEKWNEKKGNTLMEFKYFLLCSSIDLFDVKDFKRNLTDGNLIKKCV